MAEQMKASSQDLWGRSHEVRASVLCKCRLGADRGAPCCAPAARLAKPPDSFAMQYQALSLALLFWRGRAGLS
jgi:hypothetical protein